MNKCNRCPQNATFHVLIENDENPLTSHDEQLCGNCLQVAKKENAIIDYWSEAEWNRIEDGKEKKLTIKER